MCIIGLNIRTQKVQSVVIKIEKSVVPSPNQKFFELAKANRNCKREI